MAANCYVIGGTRVLIQCVTRLLASGIQVDGVLSDDPAVAAWAAERDLALLDPRADLPALLSGQEFDYLFSIVNFRILPAEVLALPTVAAINFHDGPLPRYRGSHVPAWALYEGAPRHAATWHLMAPAVDAGDVLLEQWFQIRPHSTALSLTYEAAEVGIELFDQLIPHLMLRTLPDPVDVGGRESRFYRRSDRMAGGGVIHAGTSAAEAERLAKALDHGSFPNPLGVPVLITEQDAVFVRQVRLLARDGERRDTMVNSITATALNLSCPDADLMLSDFTATDGSTLSAQAAAQRLGLAAGAPLPKASARRLAELAAAQQPLRAHEPWWRRKLAALLPPPLPAADFSAAGAHYGRYELAYAPKSGDETAGVIRAFLTVLARRTGAASFDFAWSPSYARDLAERTHGLAAARFPVRFDAAEPASPAAALAEAAARQGYATDLEVRLGLAQPLGGDGPSFTRIMVLQRAVDEEASSAPDTEIALLCLDGGPPTVFVRETAMDADAALDFAETVEDLAMALLLFGDEAALALAPTDPATEPVTEPGPTAERERSDAEGPELAPAAERSEAEGLDAEGRAAGSELDAKAEPAVPTLLDLFAATVADTPDAVAVRAGDAALTYAELDRWADAVAARLYTEGVGAGSTVGVLTARGPELLPAMLGVLRAGAAFLPLDPNYPADRLRRYLEVAGSDLVLHDHATAALAGTLGVPALPTPAANGASLAVPVPVTGGDLAYVLFTSGSTGEPKGVEIEHGALAGFLTGIGAALGTSRTDAVLAHTTVAFDISLLELLLPLTVGARVVIASREVARSPQRLAELIAEVTVAQATPSLWRLLLETGWTPHPGLAVLSGGEALAPATAQRLHTGARELWNLYGPTEATIWASTHRVASIGSFLPLGEPLPGMALHVLDERLSPAAEGELYLSGPGLARGYANRPERTAEVFLAHPVTGVRLYRTGDTVRRHHDGAIEWLGRADAQVKVRGNRIEPGEIERVLTGFPTVTGAAVVAVPFEGHGEPRLTAYLVASDTPAKADLDAFVADRLPDYMVPSAYVRLDAFPLTDNGKVARGRLPHPTRDTVIRTADPSAAPVAPAALSSPEQLAEAIAAVFATVLGHGRFGVRDNFFDLGGDSSTVPVAAAALQRELGYDVSAPLLFATGTPARLAALLLPEPAPAAAEPTRTAPPVASTRTEAAAPAVASTRTEAAAPAVASARIEAAAPAVPSARVEASVSAEPSARVTEAVVPAPVAADPEPIDGVSVGAGEDALAVIGMACRFPGAATPDEFWANLAAGVSSVGDAPPGHRGWAHLWTAADEVPTGWVDDVELFDAARFGLTEREARRLDPLQRLLLSVTDEALESCGHDGASLGPRTGVFVGTIASDFPELVAGSIGHGDPHVATGTAVSMVANRLSHTFDWTGPSFAVDTACSSSLVALHQAAMHLRAGQIDAAVVGAANLVLTPAKTRSFLRNGMLSPQGRVRTFDDGADGYVRGEGAGVVILKRLADARRDGDPVLAVVRGIAVNHTGASVGFLTAPSTTAQQSVIRAARAASGGGDVGYIEAHGTGTQLGDLIELEALQAALGAAGPASIAVGSVKTNIGHLEPAAGIAGLIKTVLALQAGQIPPSVNLTTPNRAFRFEQSPLFVPDRTVPWHGPRAAGVSSFGFGGVNAHAVLEAAPAPQTAAEDGPFLLTLSAGSAAGLRGLAERVLLMLRSPYCPPLGWLCAAGRRRPAAGHRLACVVDSAEQLDDKLMLFLAGVDGARLHTGAGEPTGVTLAELGERPRREVLDQAARRFAAGDTLPAEHGPVRFPTAPHEQRRLWLDPAPAAVPAGTWTWSQHPEAAEHVVLGDPTLPGAAYPDKVAEIVGGTPFALRDLTLRAAVRPPAVLTAHRDGAMVVFRDGSGAVVCDAQLVEPPTGAALAMPADAARFTAVSTDGLYQDFARQGLHYGAGFRCLTALAAAPGEAIGTVSVDASGPAVVDTRLLDGAFQVALVACGAQGLYVPFSIERLTVLGRLTGTARVYARRERGDATGAGLLTASLLVLDGDTPVLEARGVTWKRVSPAEPRRPDRPADGLDLARFETTGTAAAARNGHATPRPGPGSSDGLGTALARWVAEALETDLETLELDRPLEEQGLDSMLAVSLAQDIRARLGVDIPVTLVLEAGTVEALAAELRETYGVTTAPGSATPAAPAAALPTAAPVAAPPTAVAASVRVSEPDRARDVDDLHDIAIVGYDGVFPNAADPQQLWRVVTQGEDCLREVPKTRWDIDAYYGEDARPGTVYLRRAGFVDDLTGFDAGFFRISPAEAQWIDPQQRHLIQSAWRALEDAGMSGARTRGTSVGVFVGASYQHYRDLVVGDVVQTPAGLGNHNAILANRVSYFLDLSGPSMTIDTLCSSSLVALHTAVRSIRNGECDQAIVAGVHMGMSPQYFQLGSRLRSFSPSGASRAFDAGADGFVPGEGVVTVVVKPLSAALRDGDRVRGVVRGSAVNHGGRTSGLTVPSGAAQREVIGLALRDAGVDPSSIGLVEAHGTGTALGDPIEVEGLSRAWREFTGRCQFAAIGSVKSNIGHLEPAAGLAGLVKVLLAMEHGVVPPTLHVVRPNDHIRFEESPFFVADRVSPWVRRDGLPRRASVSAFGMGGVNAHIIVEEPPAPADRTDRPAQDAFVVRVSGASEPAVRELAARYASGLESGVDVGDFAYTANTGRATQRWRAAVSGDRAQLVQSLHAVASGSGAVGRLANQAPSTAFMFTGQGAQYPGMGYGLYRTEPVFRQALDECADLLAAHDVSLFELLYGEERPDLTATANAQVGIVSVQVALTRLLGSWGVIPAAVVGHSVGELTAAWAAGVLDLAGLLAVTVARGRAMGSQPAGTGMAVVHADAETVAAELRGFPRLEIAAFNAPKVVSVAGPVEQLDAFCAASALRTQRLAVSHGFHSAAMQGAVEPFAQALRGVGFDAPRVPFASTSTGGWHSAGTVADVATWTGAVRSPVRFVEALRAVRAGGAGVFWEVGPTPTLSVLGPRILEEPGLHWRHTLRQGRPDQPEVQANLAAHYSSGLGEIDWAGLHEGRGQRTTTIPTYPFQRQDLVAPPAQEPGPAAHPLFDRHYETGGDRP